MKKTTRIFILMLIVINIVSLALLYKTSQDIKNYKSYIWHLLANESFDYKIPPTDKIVKRLLHKSSDLLLKEELLSDILDRLNKWEKVRQEIIKAIIDVEWVNYYKDQATNDYHNKKIMNMKYEILRYIER